MMASFLPRTFFPGRKGDREALSVRCRLCICPDVPTTTGVVLGEGKTWGASSSQYGIPPGGVPSSSAQYQRLRLGLFSLDPHADVTQAVHQGDPVRLALGQKPHRLAVHQLYLVQIHSDVLLVCFAVEEALQLRHLGSLDAPTEGEEHEGPLGRSLNFQHSFSPRTTCCPVRVQGPGHA